MTGNTIKNNNFSEARSSDVKPQTRQGPAHVAIIMDGNGRWAQARGKPRLFGHHAGAKRVKEIVRACPDIGVKYLTIFAFSTENWKRTQTEVAGLMSLFRRYIQREARDLLAEGVRVRFIGDRVQLDAKLVHLVVVRGQQTDRLVVAPDARSLGRRDRLAVHGDDVVARHQGRGRVQDAAVDRDLAQTDQPLDLAARGDAGAA